MTELSSNIQHVILFRHKSDITLNIKNKSIIYFAIDVFITPTDLATTQDAKSYQTDLSVSQKQAI